MSNRTLGHARAAIRLRALAASLALEHAASNTPNRGALERLRGAFHGMRSYVAADTTGP